MSDEKMSARARAYLGITAAFHLCLGIAASMFPESFKSPSYAGLRSALPVPYGLDFLVWGVVFLVVGLLCFAAAMLGNEGLARTALLLSVVVTGAVAGSFVASWVGGTLNGPTGPLIWAALALKDMTMLRNPLRNPFEPVVQRVLANSPKG